MRLNLRDSLVFVTLSVEYHGRSVEIPNVLLDTGSASTVMATDAVTSFGIVPEPSDVLRRIRGVGGVEYVFSRRVDRLSVDQYGMAPFEVEIGALDYGFEMNGILGLDFLLPTGAIIDLHELKIGFRRLSL